MATAALIQDRIYYGYSKSAEHLGLPFIQYRPADPLAPLGAASQVNAALLVALAVNFDFGQPNKYGAPTWKALADGRVLAIGDYLVGAPGTFFIAAMESMLPIVAVECNRTLNFSRAPCAVGTGVVKYGGATQVNAEPVLAGWPASVLEGTKGQNTTSNLPGDTRAPWWKILVPSMPGVELQYGDMMGDDIGRRYMISSAEQSDMGWRLTAQQNEI